MASSPGEDQRPDGLVDDAETQLRHAARQYWLELGWATTVRGRRLELELDEDILGFLMPTDVAVILATRLRVTHLSCPIVNVPDHGYSRCVLLFEPIGVQELAPRFPSCVGTLPSGYPVPLPPSITAQGPVHWLAGHEPDGSRRPSVRAVVETLAGL